MLQWQRLTGNEQVLSVDSDANSADQPVDRIWIECYTRALVVVHGQELKFWQQHLGYAIDTCDAFARNGRTWAWRIQVFNLYTVTKSFPLIESWKVSKSSVQWCSCCSTRTLHDFQQAMNLKSRPKLCYSSRLPKLDVHIRPNDCCWFFTCDRE
jgi:hypothetical protein